jgi:hypothetical protein
MVLLREVLRTKITRKLFVLTLSSAAEMTRGRDLGCLLFYSKLPVKLTFHLAELP